MGACHAYWKLNPISARLTRSWLYGLSNYFYQRKPVQDLLQESRQKQPFDVTPFIKFGVDGFAAELKGIIRSSKRS